MGWPSVKSKVDGYIPTSPCKVLRRLVANHDIPMNMPLTLHENLVHMIPTKYSWLNFHLFCLTSSARCFFLVALSCVIPIVYPNFSRFNMIVIPKTILRWLKKTWRVMELVHWTNSSYIPLMGFEQTGHSWKATGTSLSGAGLRPEGPRRFWGDAAAWGWERAKVTGERWQLNNKNHQNFQERWISLMKNGEFQKEPGYLTVTWLTKKGGFHHEKDGFDLATIENSLKNRISPSTIKI